MRDQTVDIEVVMLDVGRQVLSEEHERISATFLAWHRVFNNRFFSGAFSQRRHRRKIINVVAIIIVAVVCDRTINGVDRWFHGLVNQKINR